MLVYIMAIMNDMQRNLGVDLFKFFAVFWVVGYWHIFNYVDFFPSYKNIVTNNLTRIALGFFVFVSGLYCGNSLQDRSHFQFIIDRLIHLYPLYLLAIFLFFLGVPIIIILTWYIQSYYDRALVRIKRIIS